MTLTFTTHIRAKHLAQISRCCRSICRWRACICNTRKNKTFINISFFAGFSMEGIRQRRTGGRQEDGVKSTVIAVAIPLVLGVSDALFFNPNSTYYKELKKPSWNPPGWLYGWAWIVLYSSMGLASWLVWVQGGFQRQGRPLLIYATQLFINLLWPAIFFGLKKPGLALLDIAVLDVVVYVCLSAFKPQNHVAVYLFQPYLAWVLFATALNYKICTLN